MARGKPATSKKARGKQTTITQAFSQSKDVKRGGQETVGLTKAIQKAKAEKPLSTTVKKQAKDVEAKKQQQAAHAQKVKLMVLPQIDRSKLLQWHDLSDHEILLRQHFDMKSSFGPAVGMTRRARYDRAVRNGLNPPAWIPQLLDLSETSEICLWEKPHFNRSMLDVQKAKDTEAKEIAAAK